MLNFLKSLAHLGVGVVSAGLLVLAILAMSLTRAMRSEMITIKPELFLHMAATVIAIVGLWKLLAGESKVAARLGAMALAGFLLANVPLKLPGTWNLGATAIQEADNANARLADALEVAKAVPGISPRFTKDGHPRYYWSPTDEPPVFYDRAGIHPDKGTPLSAVNSDELFVMILRRQAQARIVPEVPKVAEVPKPVEAVVLLPAQPTPAPEPVQEAVAMQTQTIRITPKPWRPEVAGITGVQHVTPKPWRETQQQ